MPRSSTSSNLVLGSRCCYLMCALTAIYVPTMALAFIANGNLTAPICDPYLAIMDVLILVIAVALVVVFAALHDYAPASAKTLSLAAFGLMGGSTVRADHRARLPRQKCQEAMSNAYTADGHFHVFGRTSGADDPHPGGAATRVPAAARA